MSRRCFVTVGSTKFDDLIRVILSSETLNLLKEKGFDELSLQYGSGEIDEFRNDEESIIIKNGIKIEYFRYKPSISDEMNKADTIIGHAGAGTCMESLRLGKPLIVVINDKLMDNHQMELAEKLFTLGYALCSIPSNLNEMLKSDKLFNLKKFTDERGDFGAFLDEKLGLKVA